MAKKKAKVKGMSRDQVKDKRAALNSVITEASHERDKLASLMSAYDNLSYLQSEQISLKARSEEANASVDRAKQRVRELGGIV